MLPRDDKAIQALIDNISSPKTISATSSMVAMEIITNPSVDVTSHTYTGNSHRRIKHIQRSNDAQILGCNPLLP